MNTAERIRFIRGELTQQEFAEKLGVHKNSIGSYERNTTKPDIELLQAICTVFRVEPRWLLFGDGPIRVEDAKKEPIELVQKNNEILKNTDDEIIMIPMVEAVLSAGGGSLETGATIGRGYAFRRDFIQRKGNPNNMVLMRVAGDSMEPEILSGDVVLIDQGKTRIVPGHMFAVGFEEAIYLKRIDIMPGKAILKSVNPAYPPMELDIRGQLSDQFRVIGRVLWSGREYK